jgi:hypothetical protein
MKITYQKFRYFRDFYHFYDETGVSALDVPAAIARLKEEVYIYPEKMSSDGRSV